MILSLIAAAASAKSDASSLPILSPGLDLYPEVALVANEGGTTVLMFDILPNGSAAACNVIQSSGYNDLDKASCSLATSRQQFAPHDGNAIPMREAVRWNPSKSTKSEWGGAIPISPEAWVTPDDYPATALKAGHQGTVEVQFDVSEGGSAQNCNVIASSGDVGLDAATCQKLMDRASLLPAVDSQGHPHTAQARTSINWQIPRPANNTHRVTFDAQSAGSVCYLADNITPRLLMPAFCNELANAVSEAGGGVDGVIYTQLPDPIPYASPN